MTFRRIATPIRVDFTPFVDLAFLLLTFFMLIKTVKQPNQMNADFSDNHGCFEEFASASATMFLLRDNKIGFLTYRRDGSGAEFLETDYSAKGLRKQLMYLMPDERAIVLIIPTAQTTYKNIVDVLDELQIQPKIRFRLAYGMTSGEKRLLLAYDNYKMTNPSAPVLMRVPLYPHATIDTWRNIPDFIRPAIHD